MAKVKPPITAIKPPVKASKSSKKKSVNNKLFTKQKATSKHPVQDTKPLQIRINASLHQEIKLYAVQNNTTITDLFIEMYNEYRSKHG